MSISMQTIRSSALAERAAFALDDAAYHRKLARHLRLAVAALLIGAIGTLLSIWSLFQATLSTQATQFWFLCLLLAGGVFCVAALTLASSVTAHLSMQRLALYNRDTEVFESTRDKEEVLRQVQALADLIDEVRQQQREPDAELVRQSLTFIYCGDAAQDDIPDESKIWPLVAEGWRAEGASSRKLQGLKAADA